MIALEPINYGGRLFMTGESVKGHIPADMLEQLAENGMIGEQDKTGVEQEESGGEGNTLTDPPIQYPTIEEFMILHAPEQKALLESLNLEPGTRLEERLLQYEEWMKSNV